MSRSSHVTAFDSTNPGLQAVAAVMEKLHDEIPPEKIARRIRDMLEATCSGPSGAESPDWRTVEAGLMLYLACVRPAVAETRPVPDAQDRSRTANGAAQLPALQDAVPASAARVDLAGPEAPPPPVANPVSRRPPEPLEMMRKMMVMDPHVLAFGGDAGGQANPRRHREVCASALSCAGSRERAVAQRSKPPACKTPVLRQSRWLAMLLLGIAAVYMAGRSVHPSGTTRQAGPQSGTARPGSPAATVRSPQHEALRGWFLEDLQAEFSSGAAHRDLLE